MGKFTNFVLNQGGPELDADQAAALTAAEQSLVGRQGGQTVTPTEALQERVPQATPVPSEELAGVSRVREQARQGELVKPAPEALGGVIEQTEAEAEDNYRQQLERERTKRELIDIDAGVMTLPIRPTNKSVGTIANNIAKMEHAFDFEEGSVLSGGILPKEGETRAKNPGLAALAKLNLTEGKRTKGGISTSLFVPKKGTGGAAYLATLLALQKLTGDQERVKSKDEGGGKIIRKGEADKYTLLNQIATEMEALTQPSQNVTPQGESTGQRGLGSRLSSEEKQFLGDMVLRMGQEIGVFGTDDGAAPAGALMDLLNPGDTHNVPTFGITPEGTEFMQSIAPMLKELSPGSSRPVSFTPLPKSTYVGEAATRQKEITAVPDPKASRITPVMEEAMDVIGNTPNIISGYKLDMVNLMYQDVQQKQAALIEEAQKQGVDPNALVDDPRFHSEFEEMLGLGLKRQVGIEAESTKEAQQVFEVKWNASTNEWINAKTEKPMAGYAPDGTPEQDFLSTQFPKADGVVVDYTRQYAKPQDNKFTHQQHAANVIAMQNKRVKDTIDEATAALGKSFYYGATVIGNSGRLMYSQTEINPQSNKLARFMIDNPRPSQVTKKNGKGSRAFEYVIARSLIEGADTKTVEQLMAEFNDRRSQINPIADAVYSASQAGDPQALNAALKSAKDSKIFPDEWGSTDEWGFIVDGLHELGKFNALPEGGTMATRVKVEVDGINNGSSIQGLQFGDETILQRAGVLYDPETGSVLTDEENMRDYVFGHGVFEDPNAQNPKVREMALRDVSDQVKDTIAENLPKIFSNGKWRKKFIKLPLMTTIYGKGSGGHADSVADFIKGKEAALGITPKNRQAMIKGYASVIQQALKQTLNDPLVHQDLVKKQASWFFTVMNVVPKVKGANGYIVQSGGYDRVGDERVQYQIMELDEKGQRTGKKVKRSAALKQRVPSATSRKEAQRGREPELFGEHTRNQLAVNGTHNIDATIAQRTLIRAKNEMGQNFWGHQVFDAFIGDVSSIDVLLKHGNQQFLNVNKRYNMIQAEYDAFLEALTEFNDKMKALPKDAQLNVVDGEYKGVKAFIDEHLKTSKRNQADNDLRWLDGVDGFEKFLTQKLGLKLKKEKTSEKKDPDTGEVIENFSRNWSLDSKTMTPDQMRELILYMRNNFLSPPSTAVVDKDGELVIDENARGKPIRHSFADNIKRTERAKQKFFEENKDKLHLVRQFN